MKTHQNTGPTWDPWLNNKIAEAQEKEQRAMAILDKIDARRLQRASTGRARAKTEAQPEQQ